MSCSHLLRSFTFSNGQTATSCVRCSYRSKERREILCPREETCKGESRDAETPEKKIETERQAGALFPVWEASLSQEDFKILRALNAEDHGHNPNVIRYGFSHAQLEDLAPVSVWAHMVSVERTLGLTNGAMQHKRARRKLAEAKAEIQRRVWEAR